MNKPLLPVLFLPLICCFACHRRPSTDDLSDKREATTLAILSMLSTDAAFKNELKSHLPSARSWADHESKTSVERSRRIGKIDSIEHILDTAKIKVKVWDTLIVTDPGYLKRKLRNGGKNPSSLYTGLENWETSIKIINNHKLLDAHELQDKGGYRFLMTDKIDSLSSDWLSAGNVRVSEVYFNDDRTKAFVYEEIFCGSLCGASYDIFLEKRHGNWIMVRRIMGWVS